jgi:hypothetical protein
MGHQENMILAMLQKLYNASLKVNKRDMAVAK